MTTWFRWDPDRVAAAVAACPEVTRLVAAPTPSPLRIPERPGWPLPDGPDAAVAAGSGGAVEDRGVEAADYGGGVVTEERGVDDAARDRLEVAEVATYLPGRRVAGVRVRADRILVQVDCRYGPRLADLADRVRAAVLRAAPDCPRVDVIIRDLDPPDGLVSVDRPAPVDPAAPGDQRRSVGPAQVGDGDQPWAWSP
ncbi:hypothetical protein [Frankia sp. AvcI1]|uniref:hypothetical protein n=1 Tax=Frankia sp. AvcI1 TaxID=573496 RepID=UPI001F2F87D9|nr:hypothetical protein [Frankia sp. AvcI1]